MKNFKIEIESSRHHDLWKVLEDIKEIVAEQHESLEALWAEVDAYETRELEKLTNESGVQWVTFGKGGSHIWIHDAMNNERAAIITEGIEVYTLSKELDAQVTHWKVRDLNESKPSDKIYKLDSFIIYHRKVCKNPATAHRRAKKFFGREGLMVTGLTMHAETKPVYYK